MNTEELLPENLKNEILNINEKLQDLLFKADDEFSKLHIIFSINYLFRLESYLQSGALNFDYLPIFENFATRIIDLFLDQQHGNHKDVASNQLDLIKRILNPAIYNLDQSDFSKALNVLSKKTSAVLAQTVRIRRMMLYLSFAVESVSEPRSFLNGEVQLASNQYQSESDQFKQSDTHYGRLKNHFEFN